MRNCNILKITKQSWSRTIFYHKKLLKNTRIYFGSIFSFYRKSNNELIITHYLQFKSTERVNMSTKILKGIKTLSYFLHFKPLPSFCCHFLLYCNKWLTSNSYQRNFLWEHCSVFILGRIFTPKIMIAVDGFNSDLQMTFHDLYMIATYLLQLLLLSKRNILISKK